MKKWWFVIIALILIIGFANAFSKGKSLEWLNKTIDYQSSSIEESAFTLLALKSNNYITNNDVGAILFQQRKDNANCYPLNGCNTKDTALAALTYSNLNVNNNDLITWIESTKTKANVEDWYIQIHTTASGECTITYDEAQQKVVTVDGTNKIRINNQLVDWINVKTHLNANLDQPIEEIIVDCTRPTPGVNDPGMLISLLRITTNNEFYIYQESQGREITLIINNACYASFPGGQCDKEASFYTAWIFKKLGRISTITPYLQKNAANNKDYAMLLSITGDQSYAQLLSDNRNTLGHWDNNIITTSFAANALKSYTTYNEDYNKARQWLERQQIVEDPQNNGSFGNVLITAVPVYLVFTEGTSISPPPSPPPGGGVVCGDNILEGGEQCDDGNLVSGDGCNSLCQTETSRCTSNLDCTDPTKPICNTITGICQASAQSTCGDNICSSNENKINCPVDCSTQSECTRDSDCAVGEKCNQGQCELIISSCESDLDCEEGKKCDLDINQCVEKGGLGAIFWASLVIVIAILIIGGYLAYTKFFKKPKASQPSFLGGFGERQIPPGQSPRMQYPKRQIPKKSRTDEALERELDKSIKEAERLLKK